MPYMYMHGLLPFIHIEEEYVSSAAKTSGICYLLFFEPLCRKPYAKSSMSSGNVGEGVQDTKVT